MHWSKDNGLVTIEVPHLLRLIERRQYDTIYHEHYQYYTLLTASKVLEAGGLRVVDVEELSTHGGSMRIHARPIDHAGEPTRPGQGDARRRGRRRAAHLRGSRRDSPARC